MLEIKLNWQSSLGCIEKPTPLSIRQTRLNHVVPHLQKKDHGVEVVNT